MTFTPQNPNNPYDYMGDYHNQIQDSLVAFISNNTFRYPFNLYQKIIKHISDQASDLLFGSDATGADLSRDYVAPQ